MKYKVGQRVAVNIPADFSRGVYECYNGQQGVVLHRIGRTYDVKMDNFLHGHSWTEYLLRPVFPLSPLEELIAAYVEAQKAELGI